MTSEIRHMCLIYDGNPSRQMAVVIPHFLRAFSMKRRCLFMGGPSMIASVCSALAWAGIDAQEEVRRGSIVLSSDQNHLVNGQFHADYMLRMLSQAVEGSLTDGFTGFWATGDMTWEMGTDQNLEKLLKYEAGLEKLFHSTPALSGICQYSKDTLPLHVMGDALMTHPSLYINHTLHRVNPFYTPPDQIPDSPTRPAPMAVCGMLKQFNAA